MGQAGVKPGEETPIEGDAVAARQRIGTARRLGVEEQMVGAPIGGEMREVARRRRCRSPS